MKKLFLFGAAFLLINALEAQTVTEAKKLMYYERYDGAARQLHSLLQADPNNAEAWWLLTTVYLHRHQLTTIKDSLQKMPPAVMEQPFALCARGILLLEDHQKDSATQYFDKALALTKEKDPLILSAVAHAHQSADSGNATYAVELLNQAIKRDKRNAGLYVQLGDAYRRLQDGGQSFKAYQDAVAQDSRYARALYKTGKIFVSQGNAEQYLKFFNDAVAADSLYAPAWYELYYHYYFRDVNKAMENLQHYISASDSGVRNDYLVTDLLYSSRKYDEAIQRAQQLIDKQAAGSEPRLYKLIAYSYKELHDSAKALDFMQQYFRQQSDTGFVAKDYETMGEIYAALGQPDSAAHYYVKGSEIEKDSTLRVSYAKKLAGLYKEQKDYSNQAHWLGVYYQNSTRSTNLDLFNWGLAHFMAKEYPLADTVFGIYEVKYPEQDFGYYWRARTDAAIDTAMATGMAIPHYEKLIAIAEKDTANKTNRKHLIESYGYIAAYKANTEKDYPGAIGYFERLLVLDPNNADAQKYVAILQKNLKKTNAQASAKTGAKTAKDADDTADAKTESGKVND